MVTNMPDTRQFYTNIFLTMVDRFVYTLSRCSGIYLWLL